MSPLILKEGFTEFEIIINPDLKFARTEILERGVKRYYGLDPTDKSHKIMYVQYPKSNFSRSDMNRILPQYKDCKLCSVGKKLIKGKNNITNMDYSIINLMGKVPLIGNSITQNRYMTEPVVMQAFSTLTRYPIAILTTELGKRLLSLFIGAGGIALVHYFVKNNIVKGEWANFFANYISSAAEFNAQKAGDGFGVKDDLGKLKRAIKSGNFYGIGDSLLSNPAKIKRTISTIQSNFSKFQADFSNVFRSGRLRATENTMPNKLFSGGQGNKFAINQAGDFKYTDTGKRFKDISNFGAGFRKERRFRESGDAVYVN